MLATLSGLGWIFMLLSIAGVSFVTYWCFRRVLKAPDDPSDLPGGLGP